MMYHVLYVDVLDILQRAEFSGIQAARDCAAEHAQAYVIYGDAIMGHYAGPRTLAPSLLSDIP